MWPFNRQRQDKQRSAIMPVPPVYGGHGHGGDPFWSWGSITGGGTISPQAAESLSAVLGAVSAISSTVASLPCWVVRADQARSEVPEHPLQALIEYGPSPELSWPDYIEATLASALLNGNAASEIETDARGRLTGLRFMPWNQITPLVTERDALVFDYLPTTGAGAGQRRRLGRADVMFLKDRSDDRWIAQSRISRAAGAMRLALDQQSYSSAFLQNAARPGGTLKTTQNLGDDQKRKLKEEWDIAFRGREYGKVAVLPAGAEYAALSQMSSEDQQIVQRMNLTVAEVCRIFACPPWLLADPSRSTFASASAAMKAFALTTLLPWTRKLESAFAQTVLSTGYRLHFDVDSLLKADINDLYSALLKGRQGGWLSPNDCRSETGFPAVPGGDDIEPPVAGGRPATGGDGAGDGSAPADAPAPSPPDDQGDQADASKIARLDQRRARHD